MRVWLGVIASAVQKAYMTLIEPFTRSDSASLGNAPGGMAWTTVRGSWGISANKASGSTASSYPLATLTFANTDITLGVDGIGPGAGTAFWVTDSGNWWGTYLDGTYTCQTCSTGGNCNAFAFNCCASGNYFAGNTYNYSYCISGTSNPGTSYSYCISGTTTPGTSYTYCLSGNSPTLYSYTTYGTVPYGTPYGAPNGNAAPCSQCGSPPGCGIANPGGYQCRNLGTTYAYNAANCNLNTTGTNPDTFTCNQSGTGTNPGGFTCNSSGTASGSNASFTCVNYYNCCNGNYNAVTYYSCNCATANSVKIIQSVANAISVIATKALTGTIVGIKTVLSGTTITVRGYTALGYISQSDADQSQSISSPVKTKLNGILLGPATYSTAQTNVIDEFRVE